MFKLDRLIKKLCPEGVGYVELGKVCNIYKGQQLNRDLLTDEGKYPAYNGGTTYSGFTDKYNVEANTIIISQGGASAGFVNFITENFWANAHCYYCKPNEKMIMNKYMFHFLKESQRKLMSFKHGAGIPALRVREITKLKAPLPPLPVQEEIVRILDNFTELTAELTVELTVELTARSKQYEYYRDELLTFGDEVEWKTLGEVALYSTDRIEAKYLNENNYVGVDNLLQDKKGKENSNFVPTDGRFAKFAKDNILIGNIRPYLRKIWFANTEGGTNGDVLAIQLKDNSYLLPRFLFHNLSSEKFFYYNIQYSKGAKMPRGDKKAIMNFPVPIPSLTEQERIVSILDKFDTLTNDISIGLPAEIKARQKQYEYYREKLLTFEELETKEA